MKLVIGLDKIRAELLEKSEGSHQEKHTRTSKLGKPFLAGKGFKKLLADLNKPTPKVATKTLVSKKTDRIKKAVWYIKEFKNLQVKELDMPREISKSGTIATQSYPFLKTSEAAEKALLAHKDYRDLRRFKRNNGINEMLEGAVVTKDGVVGVLLKIGDLEAHQKGLPRGGGSTTREALCYEMDKVLGWNIVPPTVLVGMVNDGIMSAQLYMNGTAGLSAEVDRKKLFKVALFDFVTGAADRHLNNVLLYDNGPIAIDNGDTMRSSTQFSTSCAWNHFRWNVDSSKYPDFKPSPEDLASMDELKKKLPDLVDKFLMYDDESERKKVVEACIKRVNVIKDLYSEEAQEKFLVNNPTYNSPTELFFKHFQRIAMKSYDPQEQYAGLEMVADLDTYTDIEDEKNHAKKKHPTYKLYPGHATYSAEYDTVSGDTQAVVNYGKFNDGRIGVHVTIESDNEYERLTTVSDPMRIFDLTLWKETSTVSEAKKLAEALPNPLSYKGLLALGMTEDRHSGDRQAMELVRQDKAITKENLKQG